MPKVDKTENKNKEKKIKRPIDKRKIAQNVVIIIMVAAMLLSVAGTLIYYLRFA